MVCKENPGGATGYLHGSVRFRCDVCNSTIDKILEGAAVTSPGTPHEVRHVHKETCLDALEKNWSGNLYWDELEEHVNDILIGSNLKIDSIIQLALLAGGGVNLSSLQDAQLKAQITALGIWLRQNGCSSPLW